jgi:DNA-binding protein H-NS
VTPSRLAHVFNDSLRRNLATARSAPSFCNAPTVAGGSWSSAWDIFGIQIEYPKYAYIGIFYFSNLAQQQAQPSMNNVDVSKLSYVELVELRKQLESEIAAKRSEELKVLADGYIKKIEAAGFTAAEGLDALKPYVMQRASNSPKEPSTAPVLYRDPANPDNTWSGRGRPARWLADYETQGRKREEFRV